MTTIAHKQNLVLAVHPTAKGFGWILFEGALAPFDWGVASVRAGRNEKLMRRFERILERYQPAALVLREFEHKTEGSRAFYLARNMQHLARCRAIEVQTYSQASVRLYFGTVGACTRREIALAIAQRLPAFSHRLAVRSRGATEDRSQCLFDAAAVALTHFALNAGP